MPVLPSPSQLALVFVQANKPRPPALTTRAGLGLADHGDGGEVKSASETSLRCLISLQLSHLTCCFQNVGCEEAEDGFLLPQKRFLHARPASGAAKIQPVFATVGFRERVIATSLMI